MYFVIIKKVEGRWIVDKDSNHVFESDDGVFADGAYQEIEVSKITPLQKHPNDPRAMIDRIEALETPYCLFEGQCGNERKGKCIAEVGGCVHQIAQLLEKDQPFYPDYLDFKKGVGQGRDLERAKIRQWFQCEIKYHKLTPKSKLAPALEIVFNHLFQHKEFKLWQSQDSKNDELDQPKPDGELGLTREEWNLIIDTHWRTGTSYDSEAWREMRKAQIAKATPITERRVAREIFEWGNEPCDGGSICWGTLYEPPKKKHQCYHCWEERQSHYLLEEVKENGL